MAMAIRLVMMGASAISAQQQSNAANQNADTLRNEGAMAASGFNENMASQLRRNAVMMGNATAAAVQSGGGVGGSTKGVLDQSQLNANLDALNIKYQGIIRKSTYDEQADMDEAQGRQIATATLLKGIGSAYSDYRSLRTAPYNPGGT